MSSVAPNVCATKAIPFLEQQALLDATVDAAIIIDHRGHIEVFNRSAERLFGYEAAEVLGRNVSVLMTTKDRASHDAYMERYIDTGIPHIIGIGREVDAQRKDGSVFPAFLSVGRIQQTDPPRFVGFLQDITLRRQAIAAVQRERDRASSYLEAAQTVLMALDTQGQITLLNRKGTETLGVSEDMVLGADWLATAVSPEDHAIAREQLDGLLTGRLKQPHYCEYHVCTSSGDRRLVAWRCVTVKGRAGEIEGVLCSGEDITERRAIEQSMERTRVLLQEAQSIARMGHFEIHTRRAVDDYWSAEMYTICGIDPQKERLDFERFRSLVHPDDRDRFEHAWQQTHQELGTFSFDYRVVRPDGQVRHLHSRQQVSEPHNGGSRRVAGTVLDVTESKRAEEEARQAQERMTHVARLATMGEMAAGIAHELNQPLSAITTYAQASLRLLAAPDADTEEVGEALRQIAGQALRAGEIIRRLRSLVRNSGTPREAAEINTLIEELSGLATTDARMNDVRLSLQLAPELPQVQVDRIQIQQVILNLLRNAIEAVNEVPPDAREIRVRTREVENGDVEVSVCDTGPGVAPEITDRMFHPFCTTKASGTGLGLAISRTIVQAHKGELGYLPNTPQGACFYFRLPVAQTIVQ